MFQANLVFIFIICILTAVHANENEVGIKRSAVCLIDRVAHYNHITANYTKLGFEQKNGTTHVTCKLQLGTEEYSTNSTSFSKAKERVAREAYAKTKYTKPALYNRTCIVHEPTVKNDISLLQEYADVLRTHPLYEEQPQNSRHTFAYEVTLNGMKASAISDVTKKEAKKLAATRLIDTIGRSQVIDTLTAKYNRTKYHNMEPTKRLRKILQVSDLSGDAIYTKTGEETITNAGKVIKRIGMKVEAKDFIVIGVGSTIEEAKMNAAAKLLRHLNYTVTYQN